MLVADTLIMCSYGQKKKLNPFLRCRLVCIEHCLWQGICEFYFNFLSSKLEIYLKTIKFEIQPLKLMN